MTHSSPVLRRALSSLIAALSLIAGLSAQDLLPDEGPQPGFRRGDTDGNTEVNLTDAVSTLGFLFVGDKKIDCADAADANDDGQITLADGVATLNFLFGGNLAIPSPGAFQCGEDPTEDRLTCDFAFECRPRVLAAPNRPNPRRVAAAVPADPFTALVAAFPAIEAQVVRPAEPTEPTVPVHGEVALDFQTHQRLLDALVREAVVLDGEANEGPRNLIRNRIDLESLPNGKVFEPPYTGLCGIAMLSPTFVTDGQRVTVRNEDLTADRVRLNGFRYDIAPSSSTPGGENRELIFSDCVPLERETVFDVDDAAREHKFFRIPMDAPTGEYEVYIDSGCPAEEPESCTVWARLYVTQSYMVTTVPQIRVVGNSEDNDDSPAEINFQFASQSGIAVQQGNSVRFPTMLSGSFPAGNNGAAHLTHPDNSTISMGLPIFAGNESTMVLDECLEECASFPDDLQDLCVSQCESRAYSNHFEFSVSGFEKDGSGSQIWGIAAGIGTAALGCYASFKVGDPIEGCIASAALGNSIGQQVNQALSDDDDHLGVVSDSFAYGLSGFRWGPVGKQGPVRFGGDFKNNGTFDLFYENQRVGAPHILQYGVRILSIELIEGYEFFSCEAPNEVFIQARAHLHQGQTNLSGAVRFPGGNDVWAMEEGQKASFGSGLVVAQDTFPAENAPASPLLYVEFSVWENYSEKDLMGNHSRTLFLADLLSSANEIVDTGSSGGHPIRRVTARRSTVVNGFAGSDIHCRSPFSGGGPGPDGEVGRVRIEYEVEVTALKHAPR